MSIIVGLQPEFKSWHILNPRLALVLFGMMQISPVGLKIFFFWQESSWENCILIIGSCMGRRTLFISFMFSFTNRMILNRINYDKC